MIQYIVSAHQPQTHQFNIRLIIEQPDPQGQKLSLPRWIPGSYLIRDYARHLISITAFNSESEAPLQLTKLNGHTWRCEKTNTAITLDYTVYAKDLSVRGAYLDTTRAFFNGCALFLFPHGQKNTLFKVHLLTPNCVEAQQWQVMTTLTPQEVTSQGYGHFIAHSYEELIDHPVAMGHFAIEQVRVNQIPHVIAVSGKQEGDLPRLAQDVQKICQVQMQLFDPHPPFSRYLFLLHVTKEGYGGLEHRASTALLAQRDTLPMKGVPTVTRDYMTLLGLFSHEYFHAWLVKRIKPKCFVPYDLNQETYTPELWIYEGITSYYDDLALIRAKLISIEQYLDVLAQGLTKLRRNPGRKKQTVTEASFDAWTKFYQPNENSNNAGVSYYLKGMMVAWALDLAIRRATQHEKSLDDVLRLLWLTYGVNEQGVPEKEIEKMIEAVGGPTLGALLDQALYTTDELPLAPLLADFGVEVKWRVSQGPEDFGGKRAVDPLLKNAAFRPGYFGWSVSKQPEKILIAQLVEGSPAQLAGLSAFDEIIALNEMKVDGISFDKMCKKLAVGEKVKVHFFRQDVLYKTTIILAECVLDTAEVVLKENINDTQRSNLNKWLSLPATPNV